MKKFFSIKYFIAISILIMIFLAFCKKEDNNRYTVTSHPNPGPPIPGDTTITPFPVTQVYVFNYHFVPANVSIAKGTSISWTNRDSIAHTVTSRDGSFESGDLGPGKTFLVNFPKEGYTSYYCRYHKEGGNITVH